jgi:hypothetical protein
VGARFLSLEPAPRGGRMSHVLRTLMNDAATSRPRGFPGCRWNESDLALGLGLSIPGHEATYRGSRPKPLPRSV